MLRHVSRPRDWLFCSSLLLLVVTPGLPAQDLGFESKTVEYFEDQILRVEEDVVHMVGGTRWLLGMEPLLPILPVTEVVVLIERRDGEIFGLIYVQDNVHVGVLIRGQAGLQRGLLTWVIRELGDGAVLRTADGSFWSVDSYDQYHTRYWYPPYQVIVSADRHTMLVLDEGEKISVTLERDRVGHNW